MIFLSAQPDSSYFIWQLTLQLHNFNKLKIAPGDIQVLIGYKEDTGISASLQSFISLNKQALFFTYPDTRTEKFYPSSLRPHIIKKHFEKFPNLGKEQIFYHDSDIIFRELPNFDLLIEDQVWYLSNTKSYLDTKYLRAKGKELLENMCTLVGIDKEIVVKNDQHAGGAQYLIKNVSYQFWNKVEEDCVKLFFILNIYEKNKDKIIDLDATDTTPVQAWCADMWALLWNAWKFGHETKIHAELDFCWPQDHINRWYETKIYHDAGVLEHQQNQYFCKNLYKNKTPLDQTFDNVDCNSCSIKYVENLKNLLVYLKNN